MKRSWDGQVLAAETEIHFAGEGHRSTYGRRRELTSPSCIPDGVRARPAATALFVQEGSTISSAAVNPVDIHSTVIDLYCLLVRELDVTPELMRHLLEANHSDRLGALSLDGDGDVVLKHSLYGDTITREELQLVLASFSGLADEIDDDIAGPFGGYTVRDWAHR